MSIKLSVIIPCYNMGNYIQVALDSVLQYEKQEDIEIIIVNDGSDDNGYTKSVLDALDYPNLNVIHQNNAGLSNARNIGIASAKADYVLLLDADNKIKPDYIDEGLKALELNPNVAFLYGDLEKFGLKNFTSEVGDFDISKILVKNYIDACVVLRKSAWQSVGGYDEDMRKGYEDWDFTLRLFFKGWNFTYINKVLFEYFVRENSMLTNSNKMRDALVHYIFNKPELQQAQKLRQIILERDHLNKELKSIRNRKLTKQALKLEALLKRYFK